MNFAKELETFDEFIVKLLWIIDEWFNKNLNRDEVEDLSTTLMFRLSNLQITWDLSKTDRGIECYSKGYVAHLISSMLESWMWPKEILTDIDLHFFKYALIANEPEIIELVDFLNTYYIENDDLELPETTFREANVKKFLASKGIALNV
jgi:hypothetical protein